MVKVWSRNIPHGRIGALYCVLSSRPESTPRDYLYGIAMCDTGVEIYFCVKPLEIFRNYCAFTSFPRVSTVAQALVRPKATSGCRDMPQHDVTAPLFGGVIGRTYLRHRPKLFETSSIGHETTCGVARPKPTYGSRDSPKHSWGRRR